MIRLNNFLFSLLFFVHSIGSAAPISHSFTSNFEETEPIPPLKLSFPNQAFPSATFGVWNQIWFRSMDMNPGSQINEVSVNSVQDFSIRRFRITTDLRFSERSKLFFQVGVNNHAFNSGGSESFGKKPKFFVHDIYNEWMIHGYNQYDKLPTSVFIGGGLHAWNGVSRLSNASTNKMLTLDVPVYNNSGIEISDQLGRQFGIFVHGEVERLSYRMHLNKPFTTNYEPEIGRALDNNSHGHWSYGGYYYYQFQDRDPQNTSFLAGSYLGEKAVFNIGGGFYYNKKGTASLLDNTSKVYHDIVVLGADMFLEQPIGDKSKGMAMSIYSVYYHYNFGPNYIRTQGLLNPADSVTRSQETIAAEGFGNNKFFFGTGSIWHTTASYILPYIPQSSVRLQPYITYAMKDLDAIGKSNHFYDVGTNFLLRDHHAKLSIQYASRPLHSKDNFDRIGRAGEIMASLQFYL